jgi:hypothetical protein
MRALEISHRWVAQPCVGLWWQLTPLRAQVKKSETVEARYPDILRSDLRSAITTFFKTEKRFLISGAVSLPR